MIKRLIDKTFLKFILVGCVNTLIGTSVMFVSYNIIGLGYWISSALNYIIGSIVSYFLNKYYTFQNNDKSIKVVLRFIVNISICYFIAYGIAKPLVITLLATSQKGIQENVAMIVGMGLYVILNYFGQRFFTFKKEK